VADIVRAAIEEDADAIAVSSYQGGHNEYFTYMVDMLRERGCEHIRVIVGGGGTIAPFEIEALERHGVEKIYTPEDGRKREVRRTARGLATAAVLALLLGLVSAWTVPPVVLLPVHHDATRAILCAVAAAVALAALPLVARRLRVPFGFYFLLHPLSSIYAYRSRRFWERHHS
jgi:hypothetical protein